jgi:hypothetical protein
MMQSRTEAKGGFGLMAAQYCCEPNIRYQTVIPGLDNFYHRLFLIAETLSLGYNGQNRFMANF